MRLIQQMLSAFEDMVSYDTATCFAAAHASATRCIRFRMVSMSYQYCVGH